jgi:O-antigen ligase
MLASHLRLAPQSCASSYNRLILSRFCLASLALILVTAACFGAASPAWNVCLLALGLAVAAFWLRPPEPRLKPLSPWLLLFPAYVFLQLLPLPLFLLRLLSPSRAAALDSLAPLMPVPAFAPLAIAPAVTVTYFVRAVAFVLVFLLVRDLMRRFALESRWLVVLPIIALAAGEACLGLLQNAQGEAVQGTYTNKNHLAGLLEMALPLSAAYIADLLKQRKWAKAAMMLVLALLMLAALIGSLSKMGLAAGLAGLFVMGAIAVTVRFTHARKWLAIVGLAAMILFSFAFLPSDTFVANFKGLNSNTHESLEGRVPIWRETLHLIAAYPLFGCGFGDYETAFLRYQASVVDNVFTYAHNDYLQIASELGLGGLLLAALLLIPIPIRAVRASSAGWDNSTSYLGLGCTGAIAAIGLHSLTDFNMYVVANALALAWICGIAAGLPLRRDRAATAAPSRWFKSAVLALAVLLIVYAPLRIVFDSQIRSDWRAENLFCSFGICDTDAVMTAQTLAHGGRAGDVPVPYLLEALRRDPNAPGRWCDAGDAMLRAGRTATADYCFARAVYLGPHIPPILMQAADFYYSTHRTGRALYRMSRVLADTDFYDPQIFAWYAEKKIPIPEILASGLPPGPRAVESYWRNLMVRGRTGTGDVWVWATARGLVTPSLAREYLDYLFAKRDYEAAALASARYLGSHRDGYLETNWIFNGDFENELNDFDLDWRIYPHDGVEVTRDAQVALTGSHSMQIRFRGRENLEYDGVQQSAYVKPGRYVFEAYVRTEQLTTDRGIGFHIYDRESSSRLDVSTAELTGTHDFTRLTLSIDVPKATRLLAVVVSRHKSMKFDNQIGGTAWIDSVKLARPAEQH